MEMRRKRTERVREKEVGSHINEMKINFNIFESVIIHF